LHDLAIGFDDEPVVLEGAHDDDLASLARTEVDLRPFGPFGVAEMDSTTGTPSDDRRLLDFSSANGQDLRSVPERRRTSRRCQTRASTSWR
jgi:hypothetical protein